MTRKLHANSSKCASSWYAIERRPGNDPDQPQCPPDRVFPQVAGEEVTIDLTNVARQVRGFYNSGPSTADGCAQMAYKCVTSPTDYPINDGAFRSVHVPPLLGRGNQGTTQALIDEK